jgi:hypothetical protein
MFYPSTSLEFGRDSNVLLTSEDLGTIPSGVFVARVNLKMDMPFGAHYVRWAYSPQYKDYTTDRFVNDDPLSQFFDFDSRFQIGRSFTIGLLDHYVRGVTELQEVDPGGERVFGLTPFTLHEPRLNMEFRFGSRQRLVVTPRYAQARFDEAGASVLLSYDTEAIDARYGYLVSPPTEISLLYAREQTDQARNAQLTVESRLLTEAAGIGFARSVNDNVVTGFSTAYTRVHVEGGAGTDFSGMSFEAIGNWRLTDQMQVNLSGKRRPYQSFFLNNDYYINNTLSVRLIHQVGSRTFWQATAGYQVNNYPEEVVAGVFGTGDIWVPADGVNRRDTSTDAEIGVSYRFSSSTRMFLGYNYRRRESNIEQCAGDTTPDDNCDGEVILPFDYNDNRIILRLEAGWL